MAPISKPKPVLGKTFLKEWRDFRRVNQLDAAEAIGVSRTLLSKIENGNSPYLQPQIERLANLYQCEPGDLLGRDPKGELAPIRGATQIEETLKRIEGLNDYNVSVALSIIMNAIKANSSEPERTGNDDQSVSPSHLRELKPSS